VKLIQAGSIFIYEIIWTAFLLKLAYTILSYNLKRTVNNPESFNLVDRRKNKTSLSGRACFFHTARRVPCTAQKKLGESRRNKVYSIEGSISLRASCCK